MLMRRSTFSRVTLPEHSVSARPSIILIASIIISGVMLSSIIMSAPASTASRTISRFSTSTSIFLTNGAYSLAIVTASLTPPAAPIWLSLSNIPSERLYL